MFGVPVVLAFGRAPAAGAALAAFMFLLDIPLGYGIDLMIYPLPIVATIDEGFAGEPNVPTD